MNKELAKAIDKSYAKLRDAVMLVLTEHIPDIVTCPHCERDFVLTEIDWDRLVDDVILFMIEGGKGDAI
jgi:hypothetical protein